MISEILSKLPRNISMYEIECIYFLIVLERNDGSRTATAKELKKSLRYVRYKIGEIANMGIKIPEKAKAGRPKTISG